VLRFLLNQQQQNKKTARLSGNDMFGKHRACGNAVCYSAFGEG